MAHRPIEPNAREALRQMKLEIAGELGLQHISVGYKGNLTSRNNGYYGGDLGGTMTRRLIEMAEKELINKS